MPRLLHSLLDHAWLERWLLVLLVFALLLLGNRYGVNL
jgi:hypothetical protein